jgi:hypothetical protein
MSKRVTVILGGGLGNQLFQYFAGMYVAQKNRVSLSVEATFSQHGRSGHHDWLDVLDLPGAISDDAPRFSLRYLLAYLRRVIRGILSRVVRQPSRQLRWLRQFRSSVVGYDPELEKLVAPVTIMGYFQTWRYFLALKDSGLTPELKMEATTDWYREMEQSISSKSKILGIHIRRGDYMVNPQIGVLSMDYYKAAVRDLTSRGVTWDKVWIFSDDTLAAREELQGLLPELGALQFVEPPAESHSFESILLMSQVSSLVIANSTFSWWGAALGESSRTIVCPEKWFASMDDPTDLCPPEWMKVKSSWSIPS